MAVATSTSELRERILKGDARALARAITLVEAQSDAGRDLMEQLSENSGKAMIVGVTGPPGSGKSTLADQLAKALRRAGKTVAILAIDPSSPFSKGAILGDRIRMADHHNDPGVFIRSMANRGQLGGLAHAAFDTARLLDAAGRDTVLIETVGVGQDEVEIARVAHATVVVLVPGLGDDVQAMKAGIMEIADVFALNKADLPGIERLEQEIHSAIPSTPICRTIAAKGEGIDCLLKSINSVFEQRMCKL